jgi:hypothetical protein
MLPRVCDGNHRYLCQCVRAQDLFLGTQYLINIR